MPLELQQLTASTGIKEEDEHGSEVSSSELTEGDREWHKLTLHIHTHLWLLHSRTKQGEQFWTQL